MGTQARWRRTCEAQSAWKTGQDLVLDRWNPVGLEERRGSGSGPKHNQGHFH